MTLRARYSCRLPSHGAHSPARAAAAAQSSSPIPPATRGAEETFARNFVELCGPSSRLFHLTGSVYSTHRNGRSRYPLRISHRHNQDRTSTNTPGQPQLSRAWYNSIPLLLPSNSHSAAPKQTPSSRRRLPLFYFFIGNRPPLAQRLSDPSRLLTLLRP